MFRAGCWIVAVVALIAAIGIVAGYVEMSRFQQAGMCLAAMLTAVYLALWTDDGR